MADASHELRTPLTPAVHRAGTRAAPPPSTTELEDVLRRAAADTQNLINLADTLLRVGAPADPAGPAGTSVDVTALTGRYRATTGGRPLHLRVEPGLLVHGDAAAFGQILTNLLDNAVRHGAGPITVHADRSDAGVRIVGHDEGPGIDTDFLPHATERFARADTARATPERRPRPRPGRHHRAPLRRAAADLLEYPAPPDDRRQSHSTDYLHSPANGHRRHGAAARPRHRCLVRR